MESPRWIWQTPDWPPIRVDPADLQIPLAQARSELGRLLGKAEAISPADLPKTEQAVWSQDAVATAAIEGESLDLAAVHSSVARRLGVASTPEMSIPRDVEGLLNVMEDAGTHWDADLTENRLKAWHAELFPQGEMRLKPIHRGEYRTHSTPMQIVSGPMGRETVHYEAPPSHRVADEMRRFIDWFNATRQNGNMDGLVRAAIAHLWFESIHPFEDGNGRIGRALMDLAIAQDVRARFRLHGLSKQLQRGQAQYYDALNRCQRNEAALVTWTTWLLNTFRDACRAAAAHVDEALDRARFWAHHKEVPLNPRQRKALNRMLVAGPGNFEGGMTPRKYQSLTQAAGATATRDLLDLVAKGLLVKRGAGRSTRYELGMEGWEWVKA